jgi:hypothetical protein
MVRASGGNQGGGGVEQDHIAAGGFLALQDFLNQVRVERCNPNSSGVTS